ncbi:MAG: hypothetical protein IJB79_01710 [Candidatus Gastranaerophilales bacterium]|nr:hypothetical protein [Candidatus Gastranaerophilales bacterium]
MKKDKITFLKEQELKKRAKKDAEFLENKFAQNPIQAKLLSFQKLKREISLKDLF